MKNNIIDSSDNKNKSPTLRWTRNYCRMNCVRFAVLWNGETIVCNRWLARRKWQMLHSTKCHSRVCEELSNSCHRWIPGGSNSVMHRLWSFLHGEGCNSWEPTNAVRPSWLQPRMLERLVSKTPSVYDQERWSHSLWPQRKSLFEFVLLSRDLTSLHCLLWSQYNKIHLYHQSRCCTLVKSHKQLVELIWFRHWSVGRDVINVENKI